MRLIRNRPFSVFALVVALLGPTIPVHAQSITNTYRQAAQSYRAMAANASGAAQQCDYALANYYDSVANSMMGQGSALPQPSCTPGSGSGSSGANGSTSSGGFGSAPNSIDNYLSPDPTARQVQQVTMQGLELFSGWMNDRQARKANEERQRQEAAQRQAELQKQQQQQALEQQIAEENRKIQERNDEACQLLIQSRALAGQTVDLAGENACSRIVNATLQQTIYRPISGTRSQPPRQPEPVIDGSNIPSAINFNQDDGLDSLQRLIDSLDLKALDPISDHMPIAPPDGSALDRLFKSTTPATNVTDSKTVEDKLNKLLDAMKPVDPQR